MTEVVFTSGVELHIRRQRAAVLVQKSDQSAVMVEMAMAHDQRVDFLRIDADDIEIVEQCLRRVAVIEHECAILTGLLRLRKLLWVRPPSPRTKRVPPTVPSIGAAPAISPQKTPPATAVPANAAEAL